VPEIIIGSPSSRVIGKAVRHETESGTSMAPMAVAPRGCAFFLSVSRMPGFGSTASVVLRQLDIRGNAATVISAFFRKTRRVSFIAVVLTSAFYDNWTSRFPILFQFL
jgi:hypothetical protein